MCNERLNDVVDTVLKTDIFTVWNFSSTGHKPGTFLWNKGHCHLDNQRRITLVNFNHVLSMVKKISLPMHARLNKYDLAQ